MKKIFTLVITALLLSACTGVVNDTNISPLAASGGVVSIGTTVRTMDEIVPVTEISRVITPYYYTVWDYCVIDGTRMDNVSFTWTDLGMAMVMGGEIIYRPNLTERITECRGTVNEG